MSSLPSTVRDKQPSSGRGRNGAEPPTRRGGGDFRGGGSPDFGHRMRRARFGLIAALAPILTLFVGITVAYVLRHGTSVIDPRTQQYIRYWVEVKLPVGLLLFNTAILLLSSFTMEMSRRQVAQQAALEPLREIPGLLPASEWRFPWLGASFLLSLAFLVGQGVAWHVLAIRGFFIDTSASSSFVYLLTGAHAVHLAGGMVVLGYAQTITLMRKNIEYRRIVVDLTAWYWHFMAVLWIYIFALLYFAR
ncbi:MAG TPA: cytochrome c oxidase subunit 3 [Terriglobales bacterium]